MNDESPQNELKRIRMTDAERAQMRANLRSFVDSHQAPVRSPYARAYRSRWHLAAAFAMVMLLVLPTAFAAERSLPGSPFYYIKTAIIEPVEETLAFSPDRRAAVVIENAEERLRETAELIRSDESAEEVAIASKHLARKVRKAQEGIAELEGGVTSKIELQKELLTVLEAYVGVLESDDDSETYASSSDDVSTDATLVEADLKESIETFTETASEEAVTQEVVDSITEIKDMLDDAAAREDVGEDAMSEEQKEILNAALEATEERLESRQVGDALEILIFSDQEVDVLERLEDAKRMREGRPEEGRGSEDGASTTDEEVI